MSSVEDFLHDQQFEGLDELDADAEEALLADNDEGSEKDAYDEVEYVDDDGNPVEIGENEEVEVFEITEGHDGYQHEEREQGFDDVLDLEVDDDLEFQTTQDAGTPGTSIPTNRQDIRRVTATTYAGATNVKTPNEVGSAQDEKAELDFTMKEEEEENESRLLSDSEEEEEEDDDGARGRFKSERANMVSLTRVKQRVDIPDSLDAIVVNPDVSKGPGRLVDQRKPNSYGQNRNRDRNSAQWTHGPHGPQGPNAGNALLPVPIPLLSLPFQQPQKRGASHQSGVVKELVGHQQPFRVQQENKEQWTNQQGDGGHGSRKILINPHFKGGSPTHKGTNSSHRVLQTDKQPKYDGNRTAHNEYVQQPVHPVPTQQQQPGPQLGHHLRYSAPFGQPPPQVRPPENQNPAQIHQTFVQHRFPPPDPQVQIQHPNPAAGHPLLLHPSTNQPPPNYQCSQFSLPLLPPPQMRTLANPSGGYNPSANNYATQGSVLGNYPGTNSVGQMYPPRRMPNEPQHHQPPPPPQFNQYPPWNHEMNEPWRFPAQGPNPMAPPPVQQQLPPPPHPPQLPTRWRHPQMQGPSMIPLLQQQQQHQMQMHPRPQQQHPNFSAPPPLPQAPVVQRQVYRAQGPPLPPHGANLMGQFRATRNVQNVRPQTFRRQDTLPINPQGTGPVLRLISPVPMHELRRKQQQQLGQQQQEQMLRKRPAVDVTGVPLKTARGPGGLPLKVAKVTNPLLNKPQGVKARVGVTARPGVTLMTSPAVTAEEPATSSAGVGGNKEEDEEEDEEMKAYRAKIEMQKRKREEILRIKELRRQKMAEMRRKELLQTNKPNALPVIEVPPQTVAARLRPEVVVDPMVPSPMAVAGKKRVYLVRRLSNAGVAPVVADGPLQNVANRSSSIGSSVVNLGNKDTVLLRKQQVQSRITPRPNPNLNRTPSNFPAQTTRIVTFQNNVDVNFANALPAVSHPTADAGPKRNFQMQPPQQVIATTSKKASTVLVENLAQATTDAHLKKLCSTIGPVESVRLDKVQRVAQIVFPNVSDAETFISKYQRRMVDLSVINISMV